MKILITGGAGFIGSALVHRLLTNSDHQIINLDVLSYAAQRDRLQGLMADPRYSLEQADVCDRDAVFSVFREHTPDAVIHLAGESHIDRSLQHADRFLDVNLEGTRNLLDAALEYADNDDFRMLDVSSEEVYGFYDDDRIVNERSPFRPVSPYAISKARASELCASYHSENGLPVISSFCCNNYGPGQHVEKFIPSIICNALNGKPIDIYGDGSQRRCWLYIDDHVDAILKLLDDGEPGGRYNINGDDPMKNNDLADSLCSLLDRKYPKVGSKYREQIQNITTRANDGSRSGMDDSKIRQELDWRPRVSLEQGLTDTIDWYLGQVTELSERS